MMPMKLLEENLNRKISLLLKDNRIMEGTLTGFDEYMNMVMDDVEEVGAETTRKLGSVIIRGSNIVRIVPL
ncbi:MAG: LSM domain-containing protein [Candidatus Thermoplasmatota archaeon]|jgi:small nuclear ribonucleoprotein|nr:LSM domain-containing protein [Candidatus Thermoplasmatota archaeon]MCL5987730.1 LSM domain-containing protein [Candidatus Thermoplasmatota archaeon]